VVWHQDLLQHAGKPACGLTLASWEGIAYMIVLEPRYLPPLARSAHAVAARGRPHAAGAAPG
jgi:hypothetical protein